MREILFRGKHAVSGEWIYGDLLYSKGNYYIHKIGEPLVVYASTASKTVGQYTGLTDKNGTKIFEGDIVQWTDELNTYKSSVEWCGDKYSYPAFDLVKHDYGCNGLQLIYEDCCVEVIGNIYDNPELLRTNK